MFDGIKEAIKSALSEFFIGAAKSIGNFILEESFTIGLLSAFFFTLLIMMGSKNVGKKGLYWTICGYVLVQIGGAVVGLTE